MSSSLLFVRLFFLLFVRLHAAHSRKLKRELNNDFYGRFTVKLALSCWLFSLSSSFFFALAQYVLYVYFFFLLSLFTLIFFPSHMEQEKTVTTGAHCAENTSECIRFNSKTESGSEHTETWLLLLLSCVVWYVCNRRERVVRSRVFVYMYGRRLCEATSRYV